MSIALGFVIFLIIAAIAWATVCLVAAETPLIGDEHH